MFLEEHEIHLCLLLPNTTGVLQPRSISVNKPAQDFLLQFQEWYSNQVMHEVDWQDIVTFDVQPIHLRMTLVKEVGTPQLEEMAEYIVENPKIIVNGFIWSGTTGASNGSEENTLEEE